MRTREGAGQTCPDCGCRFRVLADEVGMHPCPRCGFDPFDQHRADDPHCTCNDCVSAHFEPPETVEPA